MLEHRTVSVFMLFVRYLSPWHRSPASWLSTCFLSLESFFGGVRDIIPELEGLVKRTNYTHLTDQIPIICLPGQVFASHGRQIPGLCDLHGR